jgi:hypothetical protein
LWQAVHKICISLFDDGGGGGGGDDNDDDGGGGGGDNDDDDKKNNNNHRHITPGACRPSAQSSPQFLVPVWVFCMYASSFYTFGLGSFLRCFLDCDVL